MCSSDVDLMLGQRLRRLPNIKLPSGERDLSDADVTVVVLCLGTSQTTWGPNVWQSNPNIGRLLWHFRPFMSVWGPLVI